MSGCSILSEDFIHVFGYLLFVNMMVHQEIQNLTEQYNMVENGTYLKGVYRFIAKESNRFSTNCKYIGAPYLKENNNASGLNPSGNAYLFSTLCASKTNPDIVFIGGDGNTEVNTSINSTSKIHPDYFTQMQVYQWKHIKNGR